MNEKKNTTKQVEEKELSIIEKMMKEISETEDKIEIDGRKYTTVGKRNEILRKYLGFGVKVITEPLKVETDAVVFCCTISVKDGENWIEVATGHSEENRTSSEINKAAALENAETSAIGRALANLGLTGGEFASLNEMKTKTGADLTPEIVAHIKSLIKISGLKEKDLFAVYNIKSLDKASTDISLKIMNECLKVISNKNKDKEKENDKEDDVRL